MPQVDAIPEKTSYIELLNGNLVYDNLIDYTFSDDSLAISSWMEKSPIADSERQRELGNILRHSLLEPPLSICQRVI